eukprot:467379_1
MNPNHNHNNYLNYLNINNFQHTLPIANLNSNMGQTTTTLTTTNTQQRTQREQNTPHSIDNNITQNRITHFRNDNPCTQFINQTQPLTTEQTIYPTTIPIQSTTNDSTIQPLSEDCITDDEDIDDEFCNTTIAKDFNNKLYNRKR